MRVLVNNSHMRRLAESYPQRCGFLVSPPRRRITVDLPYGIDNGAYSAYLRGTDFDDTAFWRLIADCRDNAPAPLWVVVPDCVGSALQTLRMWEHWEPKLRDLGWPLAFAVQDGMKPEDVPPSDVIFVGGTMPWKYRTIHMWCYHFPRVHVGRVNRERLLWLCHKEGAESVDGTGWFRGDHVQLRALVRYLRRSSAGLSQQQMELAFTDTFLES